MFLCIVISLSVVIAGISVGNYSSIEQNDKIRQSVIDGIRPPSNPCEDHAGIYPQPPLEP